jgi:Fe-S cluster assembly protein SufD
MSLYEQIEQLKSSYSGEKLLALENFLALGFPTKKDEEYKYTHLKEIVEKKYNFQATETHNITKKQLDELHLGEEHFDFLVFVNGTMHPELSKISIESAKVLTLKNALSKAEYSNFLEKNLHSLTKAENPFCELNKTMATNGFVLHVPKNTRIEKPIHIFYLSQGQQENTFYNPHNLLVVEDGAAVEIIESHHNYDESFVFTNSVTEIIVGKNAKADWHKLQNDSNTSYLVDNTFAQQDRDSLATVNTFSFGGKLVRNNLDFIHNGENINSFMNGITIIGDNQLVDHHTAVHHNQPNCESYQNYKGIYKDQAKGVFNGKVFVDKIAQKTNAYQQNNNILLNEGATIDTKPQLEIFADDVKCSHGCTVGQLNEDAMFYLRARGISKKEAQALLLYAFANDTMQNIDIEQLKTKISSLLAEKLEVDLVI